MAGGWHRTARDCEHCGNRFEPGQSTHGCLALEQKCNELEAKIEALEAELVQKNSIIRSNAVLESRRKKK